MMSLLSLSKHAGSASLNEPELLHNAGLHLSFLRKIHQHDIRQLSRKSLDRYLNFWLPLVARLNNELVKIKFVPPYDIA